MLVKILGGIDIFAGIILILGVFFNIPGQIIFIMGLIILLKSSFGLLKDPASWIDFLSGSILILTVFFVIPISLGIIFGVLIIQKGLFSLF